MFHTVYIPKHKGTLSYHILRIARKQAEEHENERQRAATGEANVYRKKTGRLAEHLKRQARKRVTLRKRRRVEKMKFENMEWSPDYWADQLTSIVGMGF